MNSKNIVKVAAFDLDGTILDSADDLISSLNTLLKEQNQKIMTKNNVYSLVGNGALAMIKEAYNINLTVDKNIDWKKLQTRFIEIYKKQYAKKSKLYPYTIDALKELHNKNIKLILVSNKPQYFVKKILNEFKIRKYFVAVSGGDTFRYKKPSPKHLIETLNSVGIKKFNCCFIGDSLNDALCARNANTKLILLKHGYCNENLEKMGADYVLDDLKNLSSKVYGLLFPKSLQ